MISVIIPAYNEEASLPLVIRDLQSTLRDYGQPYEIIVANNGSSDSTAAVATEAGARVIDEPRRGYGRACLTALAQLAPQSDVVAFIDGDYSDYPEELPTLLRPIHRHEADFVVGSRARGQAARGSLTPQQRFGNWLATFLIRIFWRFGYSDLGPFRALSRRALDALQMEDKNYGWTVEMQIRAVKAKLRIQEVPVSYRKRIGKSKVSGTLKGTIMAGTIILSTIARELFARRKYSWTP